MPQLLQVSHVSRRGASLGITLPKGIRERLGLKEGDIVDFTRKTGKSYLRRLIENPSFRH